MCTQQNVPERVVTSQPVVELDRGVELGGAQLRIVLALVDKVFGLVESALRFFSKASDQSFDAASRQRVEPVLRLLLVESQHLLARDAYVSFRERGAGCSDGRPNRLRLLRLSKALLDVTEKIL